MANLDCKDVLTSDQSCTDEVDRLSLKMFRLQEIVKLAALASESTRILNRIQDVIAFKPEAQEYLNKNVRAINSWQDREDSTGEVLAYVADELWELNQEFTDLACSKSRQG